jgi:hypothetical protein
MTSLQTLLATTLIAAIIGLAGPLGISPALAQTHAHDAHEKGPNGGQIVGVGPYDAEIVVEHDKLVVRLIDHGGANLTADASGGDVVFVAGGKPTKVSLVPEGDALVGKLDAEVPDDVQAVIRIKTKDGKVHAGKAELESH